jgi:anthranilate phosphoribosyltransferase
VLNAALALELTGHVRDPVAGIRAAADALDRGDGSRLLGRLAEFGTALRARA